MTNFAAALEAKLVQNKALERSLDLLDKGADAKKVLDAYHKTCLKLAVEVMAELAQPQTPPPSLVDQFMQQQGIQQAPPGYYPQQQPQYPVGPPPGVADFIGSPGRLRPRNVPPPPPGPQVF